MKVKSESEVAQSCPATPYACPPLSELSPSALLSPRPLPHPPAQDIVSLSPFLSQSIKLFPQDVQCQGVVDVENKDSLE